MEKKTRDDYERKSGQTASINDRSSQNAQDMPVNSRSAGDTQHSTQPVLDTLPPYTHIPPSIATHLQWDHEQSVADDKQDDDVERWIAGLASSTAEELVDTLVCLERAIDAKAAESALSEQLLKQKELQVDIESRAVREEEAKLQALQSAALAKDAMIAAKQKVISSQKQLLVLREQAINALEAQTGTTMELVRLCEATLSQDRAAIDGKDRELEAHRQQLAHYAGEASRHSALVQTLQQRLHDLQRMATGADD